MSAFIWHPHHKHPAKRMLVMRMSNESFCLLTLVVTLDQNNMSSQQGHQTLPFFANNLTSSTLSFKTIIELTGIFLGVSFHWNVSIWWIKSYWNRNWGSNYDRHALIFTPHVSSTQMNNCSLKISFGNISSETYSYILLQRYDLMETSVCPCAYNCCWRTLPWQRFSMWARGVTSFWGLSSPRPPRHLTPNYYLERKVKDAFKNSSTFDVKVDLIRACLFQPFLLLYDHWVQCPYSSYWSTISKPRFEMPICLQYLVNLSIVLLWICADNFKS